MNLPLPRDGLTPEIDAACNRFELSFRSGDKPSIEEFIRGTDEPQTTTLLRELIAVECPIGKAVATVVIRVRCVGK